ncbi:MAG: hypothetical protein RR739_03360, partial [Clostridia bacterium]
DCSYLSRSRCIVFKDRVRRLFPSLAPSLARSFVCLLALFALLCFMRQQKGLYQIAPTLSTLFLSLFLSRFTAQKPLYVVF